eukprot:6012778-Pleurochrysis_carterae.AAC.1
MLLHPTSSRCTRSRQRRHALARHWQRSRAQSRGCPSYQGRADVSEVRVLRASEVRVLRASE